MMQEAFAHMASVAATVIRSRPIGTHTTDPHRSFCRQFTAVLLIAIPGLLAPLSASAAVMNLLYEGYYMDVSSIWGTDRFGSPSNPPAGTIASAHQYGSLLSSMPASNHLATATNTASSSARNFANHTAGNLFVSVDTLLDDDAFGVTVPDPRYNYTRSIWNTLFSITGADASLELFGRYLNTQYWSSEIYLFDLTDRTVNRFGHTGDSTTQTLLDGHLYALSAISSQREMGLDDVIATGFFINAVSINDLLASASSAGSAANWQIDSLITNLGQAQDTYSRYIPIPEPSAPLLLMTGLLGMAGVRQVRQSSSMA